MFTTKGKPSGGGRPSAEKEPIMRTAEIIDRTNSVYNIFKHTVRLNQRRFADMDIQTVADFLVTTAGVNYDTISREQLVNRIRNYCIDAEVNEYDTGIYY